MEGNPVPIEYKLSFKGGTSGKPGIKFASNIVGRIPPVERRLESKLDEKFPDLAGPVREALTEHTVGLGIRYIHDKIHSPKREEEIKNENISSVEIKGFASGVTKLTSKVQLEHGRKRATCFIDPAGFVPFSFRPMDIIPHSETSIPVSASLLYLAKHANKVDIPAVHMTSAGWNGLVACADRIDLLPNDKDTADEALQDHINKTTVSLDTRYDFPYLSIDKFFQKIKTPMEDKTAIRSPQYPPQDGHWLVTLTDGTFAVQSLTQLREQDTPEFRKTIASVSSMLAYVYDDVSPNPEATSELQIVNALVFFELNGQKRIGSLHAGFKTSADNMFILAKGMLSQRYPEAKKIAIGVIDGGGASGAIVQKNEDGNRKKMDTSTIPYLPTRHEVPMYIGMIPSTMVQQMGVSQ